MKTRLSGFAMGETMISLVIVAIVGMQVARCSGATAIARTQAMARAQAASLALELSDWTHRGGLHVLGGLASPALSEPASVAPACHAGDCDAVRGAAHFWSQWHARLRRAIPGARAVICADRLPASANHDWACDATGTEAVLKLGWPPYPGAAGVRPQLAVALGRWD